MKHMYLLLVLALSVNIGSLFAQNEQLDYAFHFETAKSKLPQEAQQSIATIAKKAQLWTDHSIIIQGHTDDIGKVPYNIQLSQSRAEEVKNLFVEAGIDENRITIKALGEEHPLVSNAYEEGRRTNRRVEIMLTKNVAMSSYIKQQERNQEMLNKLRSEVPTFVLNQANVERYLTTKQGTQIHIPNDAFDVPEGTVVEIKVVEAYKKSDMILNGLSTMSNGKQLVTGGMMKIEALADGQPVQLKEGKELEVNIPNKNPDQRMQLFYGDASAQTINWVNPQPLGINRPAAITKDLFYQEFKLTKADERIYLGHRKLSPSQIRNAVGSKVYLNENANRPSDTSEKLAKPDVPDPIDSSRIKFWTGQLTKVSNEINTPCATFACKWKAFFRSKKRKAQLQQKNEDRIANIKRNIKSYKEGLASQEQKHLEYTQEVQAFKAKKDSLYNDYLAKVKEWKVKTANYDSINFEYACINQDIGYLHAYYEVREKEACQKMYGVNTFEAAQDSKKEAVMAEYVDYYMPRRNSMDSSELKQFLVDYPTVSDMNKQFFKLACEKKDTNYVLWRKGRKILELSLPIMYEVSTLEEARAAQLCERIEAREDFYNAKMAEFGVETIEEAYAAHQKILKERADWKRQAGYVFSAAKLGNWINCDYFPRKSKEELITQNFDLPISPNNATTYLIFKDIASVMRGYANHSNLNNWYTFNNIPKNKAVQVVSFYLDRKGQTQVAVKSLLANENPEKLEYKPMSMEAFKKVLTNLDV